MVTTDAAIKALVERYGTDGVVERRKPVDPDSRTNRPPSQATRLVELAEGAELWHTAEGEPFATVTVDTHQEHWPIRARRFQRWLRKLFWERFQTVASSQAVQDALGVLEGKALFEGVEHVAFLRVGLQGELLYLDLTNDSWEVVEISAQGWRVVTDPPIKFRRVKGMLALPSPVPGGVAADLRQFLNLNNDADWVLLSTWILASLLPRGPYPVLILHGEQGSAKSTLAEFTRAMIDPNTAPLRAIPRNEHDLIIAANNGWCLTFDNLSSLKPWLSDAICRLATGGGFSTRTLYENDEETLFQAQRPVMLNGIEELATRGDLLDRSVMLYLPQIADDKREKITTFRDRFTAMRPRLLGAMLDALCAALHRLPNIELKEHPRMADFAELGVAAEEGLGFEPGTFLEAYSGSRDDVHSLILDASPIGQPIRDLVAKGDWDGTAGELLSRLDGDADEKMRKLDKWPKDTTRLSSALRRLAPSFRGVDIDLKFWREPGDRRRRMVSIRKGQSKSVPSVPPGSEQGTTGPISSRDAGRDADSTQRPASVPKFEAGNDNRDAGDARDARDAYLHSSSSGLRRKRTVI